MDIKNFKCDGIGNTVPAKNVKLFIQTAVSLYRLRNTSEEILEKLIQINPKDNYKIGSRFLDDDRVTGRICTGLVKLASSETNTNNTIEENIESFIHLLSGSELDQIILEGMRDCAISDHYYAFEKEWE